MSSPSGTLSADVRREPAAGTLRLAVRLDDALVTTSQLGIRTDRGDLTRDLRVVDVQRTVVTEHYETAVGKRRQHDDTAHQLTLTARNENGQRLDVQVRVFDDGVGYRYLLPGTGHTDVLAEAGSFEFPAATEMVAAEHRPNYENLHERTSVREVEDVAYQFPALFRLPHGAWALISESDVDGRYVASHLRPDGAPGRFTLEFGDGGVEASLPLATPWRLVATGSLADIVETDLVTDLATEARFPIPDWVRPGTVAWSWWSDGGSPRDPGRQREYVDHAAEEGWEYVLVDEGWSPEWVPDLVDYARQRGVGVILWAPWTDLDTQAERDEHLPRWRSWGVSGVKLDFMDSDSQARMRWYDDILADTAKYHLAVNLHGSTIPRGIERTWPHVMTMEGVRGAEDYHFGYLTPRNNVMLPFTRNVVGSMDYTPTTFSAERRETSAGHELALSVLYESGWQHPADSVESYDSRGIAEALLRELPAAWDDTRLVDGDPGESATIARRSGQRWFVGAARAGEPADVHVPLGFIDADRDYVAAIVRDEGTDELDVHQRAVTPGETLTVPTERNGGAVVVLCPAEQGACLDESLLSRVSVDTADSFVAPGTTHEVTVTVTNDSGATIRDVTAELSVPPGWESRTGDHALPASLAPGEHATATWTARALEDAEPSSTHRLRAEVEYSSGGERIDRTAVRDLHVRPGPPQDTSAHLSDLDPVSSFNWVGPIERDRSNGGEEPGDGGPITLDGRVFDKGLGGHAHSEQVYYLGRTCERFRAVVGVDDSAGERASIVFQVWGDDRLLHDSGLHTPQRGAERVEVSVRDVESLRLVMADGGDFVADDLGDWADARVDCG